MAYSKEFKLKFLKMLENNGGNVSAVLKHGEFRSLERKTIYLWKNKEEWFDNALKEVRESCKDNVETALYKEALGGNVTAQIFYLKTQAKDRGYIEKQEVEHSGSMDHKVVRWRPASEKKKTDL